MKRRDFITLVGSAVAAWPLEARAQQSEHIRRIGVLMPGTADESERLAAFEEGLRTLGWIEGHNLHPIIVFQQVRINISPLPSSWSLNNPK